MEGNKGQTSLREEDHSVTLVQHRNSNSEVHVKQIQYRNTVHSPCKTICFCFYQPKTLIIMLLKKHNGKMLGLLIFNFFFFLDYTLAIESTVFTPLYVCFEFYSQLVMVNRNWSKIYKKQK